MLSGVSESLCFIRFLSFLKNLRVSTVQETSKKDLTPSDVRSHISELWKNEKNVLSRIFVSMADAAVESKATDSVESDGNFCRMVDRKLKVVMLPSLLFMSGNKPCFEKNLLCYADEMTNTSTRASAADVLFLDLLPVPPSR